MDAGRLPRARITQDISDVLRESTATSADIITAGFPCTGFARCGAHGAFQNKDTALFHVLIEVVENVRPALVFMENTPAIRSGESLAVVKQAFHSLSYQLEHLLLPAYAVGLPHTRLRWFAIAFKNKQDFRKLVDKLDTPQAPLPPPRTVDMPPETPGIRYNLLKNALIPSCARLALKCLLSGTSVLLVKPNLGLVMQQNETIIRKSLWPTLFGNHRRGAQVLTDRCSRDLITAIKHEKTTPAGHVNFAFLEWMMGFPSNWTLLVAL